MDKVFKAFVIIVCLLCIILTFSFSAYRIEGGMLIDLYDMQNISDMQTFLSMGFKELVLDRFEGDFAVCEDLNLNMVNIHKELIPIDAPEGAVLLVDCNTLFEKRLISYTC